MARKIKNTERWKDDKLIKRGVCFECGSLESIHYHHVVPEVKGGNATIPLCYICHGKVHDRNFKNYRELQKIGIEKAKANGKFTGRKAGTKEDSNKFLNKVKNKEIIELLEQGVNYRTICKNLNVSASTITKVKNIGNVITDVDKFNKFKDQYYDDIVQLLIMKDVSVKEIAESFNCSVVFIEKIKRTYWNGFNQMIKISL
jgi:DNA invertase Pin-like site-specific DNA recombinase